MTNWKPAGLLEDYDPGGFYCELVGAAKMPAPHTRTVRERIDGLSLAELRRRAQAAEHELFNLGVTFTVYSDREQIDRILPFDVIPRVLSAAEWATIERGVVQRVTALNRFIEDVYHEQRILRDGIVPAELVLGNANFRPQMRGLKVPFGNYVNICGVDIVRGGDGRFYVLEDNARTPSGVSYVVENRHLTQRAFPDLMRNIGVRSVSNYGQRLVAQLTELAAGIGNGPSVVLLSPGVFNSAYFEHVFLAREMGVPLVEGRDLVVRDDRVLMKTTGGLARVDVIYRRIDDDFLDPEAFNPDEHARRARPDACLPRGQCRARERRRHRRRGRQGRLRLRAAHHPLLPRRGADPAECRDLHLPGTRGSRVHAASTSRSWWSSRSASRVVTAS